MTLTTINLAALGDTINLGTEVTGTLPTGNGGTGSTATTFVNAATNVTGALPIANGGTALTSGFVNGGGLTEADQWRVTSDFTPAGYVTANWERNDTNFDKIGTGMSESSGVFTFGATGIYSVDWDIVNVINANSRELKTRIFMTTNDSAYTGICENGSFVYRTDSNTTYGMGHANALVDITNVSTHKVKFFFDNEGSVGTCKGSTSLNLCWVTFTRLGAT